MQVISIQKRIRHETEYQRLKNKLNGGLKYQEREESNTYFRVTLVNYMYASKIMIPKNLFERLIIIHFQMILLEKAQKIFFNYFNHTS